MVKTVIMGDFVPQGVPDLLLKRGQLNPEKVGGLCSSKEDRADGVKPSPDIVRSPTSTANLESAELAELGCRIKTEGAVRVVYNSEEEELLSIRGDGLIQLSNPVSCDKNLRLLNDVIAILTSQSRSHSKDSIRRRERFG